MKIEAKPGKRDKIHISVDGEYLFTTDSFFWCSCGYHSGEEIDDAELEALRGESEAHMAYNKALTLLARRDHSRRELVDKLVARSFDREAAQAAADKAESYGFLDDADYARQLADELSEKKFMSPLRIKQELISKGISREIAENVSQALDIEPTSRIIELLNFKYVGKLSDEREVKRAFDALVRLGYSFSDIRAALRELDIDLPR